MNLNSFLKLGYFLDYNSDLKINITATKKELYKNFSEEELIKIGIEKYMNAVDKLFNYNEKHLVPISGGYDSRGIIASLLIYTSAKNISTYTFGVPGTFDYKIGNFISKKIGSKHYSFNLNEYKYKILELIDISKRIDHQTILFHHPPISVLDDKFGDHRIWSGVSIESWFGSHFNGKEHEDLKQEKLNFLKSNQYVKSVDLTNTDDLNLLDNIISTNNIKVPKSIELDILNRQLKYNIPHVLMKGFKYSTLFADNQLTDYALSLPNKFLVKRYLYHKILEQAFPELFKLPVKSNFGLPVYSSQKIVYLKRIMLYAKRKSQLFIDPMTNYLDFNTGIRNRNDLKKIIYENIMDLKNRKIVDWIDIDKIWNNHINKKANHADALLALASLEIHLKAGKKP